MESISAPMVAAAKLLDVIVNGDSPPPKKTVDGVEQTYPPTTAKEKLARKNELKARGTLLMALPSEPQLKFNSYKSDKSLMETIEKRFGGNKESKKVQKILLKQQYENFNGNSSEGLDQIYDRLQKLISQLAIHGETISQEDLNMKLLRSLPSEWKTHTLIWRNKSDLDTLSMDDLYNNLKIFETKVKGTNEAVKTAYGVSAANSKPNASTLPNVDSLSDAMIYSFFASQSNSSQLENEEQEFFSRKQERNLGVNGTNTIGFDKTKVECYNSHRRGHFARECMAPKQQDNRNREITRRTMPVEETTSNGLVLQVLPLRGHKDFKSDIKLRDNALTELRKKFEKAKKERDDLKHTLEKFENSSKNLSKLLDSQVSDKFKTGVGFDNQVFDSQLQLVKLRTSESKLKSVLGPVSNVFNRAHLHVKRPLNKFTTNKNNNFNEKVNTVRGNVTTTRPKAVVSDNKGNEANAVKALTCWVWRPKHKVLDHVSRNNGASMSFKRFEYVDAQGISKHMTGNISYLTDYKDIDGGFVAFEGSTKGGKITGKDFKLNWTEIMSLLKSSRRSPRLISFVGKADEGLFIRYSTNSKAFRVFNSRTMIVEENLHVKFSEDIPNIAGSGPNWIFDIDALTKSMNYESVVAGNQSNGSAGKEACDNEVKASMETIPVKDYILLPLWTQDPLFSSSQKDSPDAGFKPSGEEEKKDSEDPGNEDSEVPSTEEPRVNQEKDANVNNINNINTVSSPVNAVGIEDNVVDQNVVYVDVMDDHKYAYLLENVY
ncbi:hypothetical protein Tco_0832959 [Tanacetum coccineum]